MTVDKFEKAMWAVVTVLFAIVGLVAGIRYSYYVILYSFS